MGDKGASGAACLEEGVFNKSRTRSLACALHFSVLTLGNDDLDDTAVSKASRIMVSLLDQRVRRGSIPRDSSTFRARMRRASFISANNIFSSGTRRRSLTKPSLLKVQMTHLVGSKLESLTPFL